MDHTVAVGLLQAGATIVTTVVAVVAAVLYTVRQIRGTTYHEVVSSERQIWQTMLRNDRDLRNWWLHEWMNLPNEEPYTVDTGKIRFFLLQEIDFFEDLYHQHRVKTLQGDMWQSWKENMAIDLKDPCMKEVWETVKQWYSDEFRYFVYTELNISPSDPNGTTLVETLRQTLKRKRRWRRWRPLC